MDSTSLWKELQNSMVIFTNQPQLGNVNEKWAPDLSSRQESISRKSATINREPDKTRVDWDYKSKTWQRKDFFGRTSLDGVNEGRVCFV